MNTKSLLYILIFQIALLEPAISQIWISNNDIYNQANSYLNSEDYVEALPLFLLLEKKGIMTNNVSYKIGVCYLHLMGRKKKSLPYLKKAVDSVSSSYKDDLSETRAPIKALLELGISYRINDQLKQAISTFKVLKDSIGSTDPALQAVADLQIKYCRNAMLLGAFPGAPRTKRLPDIINNQFSNYNPVLTDSGNALYYMNQLKFYDALMVSKKHGGNWTTPKNLTPRIHSDGDYILLDVSADGKKILLYNYEILESGQIYEVDRTPDGWSEPKLLDDNINSPFNETHASFSPDGKTLYFTSNRPGGYGGLDIYMSKLDSNGDWGPAMNLGPTINTPYNEETPFINEDNDILYFSSQGHLNMGGYDVFYSLRKGKNKWRDPINMGSPVCTTDDDLFYFPLEDGSDGLMSRLDDSAATAYDIYHYSSMVLPNTPRYSIRGKSNNTGEQEKVPEDVLVVNKATSDTVYRTKTDSDGTYQLLLPAGNFAIVTRNLHGHSAVSDVNLKGDAPGTLLLAASGIPQKDTTQVNMVKHIRQITDSLKKETLALRDILFAFNQTNIRPEYKPLLDSVATLMKKYPSLDFLIEGHTDDKGSQEYNLKLSLKRAQAVANYLESEEIKSKRLKVTGKGEQGPVAINKNPDGSDNPEGRKYNRRVVIIPLKKSEDVLVVYHVLVPAALKIKKGIFKD